jgi:hypothetical protein
MVLPGRQPVTCSNRCRTIRCRQGQERSQRSEENEVRALLRAALERLDRL